MTVSWSTSDPRRPCHHSRRDRVMCPPVTVPMTGGRGNSDRLLPVGFWILPGALFGLVFWSVVISSVLRWIS